MLPDFFHFDFLAAAKRPEDAQAWQNAVVRGK
jgi:hypothetical protein